MTIRAIFDYLLFNIDGLHVRKNSSLSCLNDFDVNEVPDTKVYRKVGPRFPLVCPGSRVACTIAQTGGLIKHALAHFPHQAAKKKIAPALSQSLLVLAHWQWRLVT